MQTVQATSVSAAGRGPGTPLLATAIVVGMAVAMVAALLAGSVSGLVLFAGVAALAVGLCALLSPIFATVLLLVTMFLRLPIRAEASLPVELFLLVFATLVAATVLWMDRTPTRLRGSGAVEWAMAIFVMWNVYSMLAAHKYPAVAPLELDSFSVPLVIVVSTVIPFTLFVVGRYTFDRTSVVRALFWVIMLSAAYSAAVSIMPFTGLADLVWPRYIVAIDHAGWVGRAVGIFKQPTANGMMLALGFAIAMLLMSRREEPRWRRCVASVVAVGCGVGIYFTHTRAAWLSALAVLIVGAILAKGFRRGFVAVLSLVTTMVLINWSTFTSTDRHAGGVATEGEVESRLNDIQTALWAAAREPVEGWGIGRFPAVNTYHHQQWAPDVPWKQGYGEVAHQNELGILAELGVIGLAAWMCVLVLLAYRLWNAYKTLPDDDLCGKPLAALAIMALAIFVCTGLTVDLRYFDFPPALVFLLIGITIGWADRNKQGVAAIGGDHSGLVRSRHA